MIFMVNSNIKYIVGDFKYNVNVTSASDCTNSSITNNHTHSFNSYLPSTYKTTNFIVFHRNIWGLTHKTDEFLISLSCINPQVLRLTEHHLQSEEIKNIHLGQYTLGACFCR